MRTLVALALLAASLVLPPTASACDDDPPRTGVTACDFDDDGDLDWALVYAYEDGVGGAAVQAGRLWFPSGSSVDHAYAGAYVEPVGLHGGAGTFCYDRGGDGSGCDLRWTHVGAGTMSSSPVGANQLFVRETCFSAPEPTECDQQYAFVAADLTGAGLPSRMAYAAHGSWWSGACVYDMETYEQDCVELP